jgi:signal transduction histidine kinase
LPICVDYSAMAVLVQLLTSALACDILKASSFAFLSLRSLTVDSMDDTSTALQFEAKDFLRPILFGLTEEDLDVLARAAVERVFAPGDVICREGELGDVMYFIVDGRVEIVKQVDEGSERHLHYVGSGEYFGEIAILQEGPRVATVRAVERTTTLEVGQMPFLTVLGRSPSLGIRILVRMTDRLRDADQQAIDELHQANVELTRMLRKLERLDRTKSDFIRVSAHELRTPVASLMGYTQMIQDHSVVAEHAGLQMLVQGVRAGAERLHRVFNSILDLSRLMTEDIEVRRSPVSLPVILRGVHTEFKQALEERSLDLEIAGVDELPFYIGDPDMLYKVFYHLINNAIKYTPDGGRIVVVGGVVEASDLGQCVEVAVEDTGIGIAPGDIDLIFEKFYRTGEVELHSSGTTSFKGGGPGLGLAIAKGIVQAHGGLIWAESSGCDEETCPGSKFVVQLPLETP